jgi:hypothetical protein
MLHGVQFVMIWMERHGGVAVLMVGTLSCSSSGSTIGTAWAGQLVMVSGLLCVLDGVGCRSWMWTWGAVGVLAVMIDGMASTLGDGASVGQLNWRVDGGLVFWFTTWRVSGCAGMFLGLLLGGRLVVGRRGLQLLATTVFSLSSLPESRIWNGLLLRVWRWWINGICRMTLGAVMLFDVVATLGGVACPTL